MRAETDQIKFVKYILEIGNGEQNDINDEIPVENIEETLENKVFWNVFKIKNFKACLIEPY